MYIIEEIKYFSLFFGLGLLILVYGIYIYWRVRAQKKFIQPHLKERIIIGTSFFKSTLKIILILLSLSFFIIALTNPKIGTKINTVKREGVDIIFALDVSKSMLSEDIAPNRLEKAKQLIINTVNSLASDRIGVVIYAGSAFPYSL